MKSRLLTALAMSVAVLGFASQADAQSRTEPAGKLFFEGDIVRHGLDTVQLRQKRIGPQKLAQRFNELGGLSVLAQQQLHFGKEESDVTGGG